MRVWGEKGEEREEQYRDISSWIGRPHTFSLLAFLALLQENSGVPHGRFWGLGERSRIWWGEGNSVF